MDGDHACMLLLKCSILKIQLQCNILLTVLNFTLSIGQSSWAACMSPGFHPGLITLCPSTNNYNLCSIWFVEWYGSIHGPLLHKTQELHICHICSSWVCRSEVQAMFSTSTYAYSKRNDPPCSNRGLFKVKPCPFTIWVNPTSSPFWPISQRHCQKWHHKAEILIMAFAIIGD